MSDTPRTDFVAHATGDSEWDRSINRFGRMQSHAQILERELAEAQGEIVRLKGEAQYGATFVQRAIDAERELVAARNEADAMDEFLGAASRHEKEAAAIIKSLTADIHITVPIRDYSEMSPKDCYELGMMDGVAALKAQINAAIDEAMKEGEK